MVKHALTNFLNNNMLWTISRNLTVEPVKDNHIMVKHALIPTSWTITCSEQFLKVTITCYAVFPPSWQDKWKTMFALIWYDQHGLMMMIMVVRGGWRWKILIGQRHAAYRRWATWWASQAGQGWKITDWSNLGTAAKTAPCSTDDLNAIPLFAPQSFHHYKRCKNFQHSSAETSL